MEVKDINNNVNQNLFTRNAALGALAPMLGSGFANLLNQAADVAVKDSGDGVDIKIRPEQGRYSDAKVNGEIKESDGNKADAPAKDKTPADKNDKPAKADKKDGASVKDKAPAKENKKSKQVASDVNNEAVAAVNVPAEQSVAEPVKTAEAPVEGVAVADEASVPAAAVEAPAPVEVSDIPVSDGKLHIAMIETNGKSTGIMESAFQSSGIDVVMNDGSFALSDPSLTLEALAAKPEVKVLMADGSVKTMTGAELAAQIQPSGEMPVLKQVSLVDMVKNDIKIPSEVMVEAERLSDAAGAAAMAADDAMAAAPKAVYSDENIALQAVALDEKIISDKPVKVAVEIKEEKASVAADDGLIQNTVELADAIQASADVDAESVVGHKEFKIPEHVVRLASADSAQAGTPAANPNVNNAALAAVNNAALAADAAEVASAKLGTEVSGVSGLSNPASTGAAHSAVMGNEFAQVAKNEAGAQTADTSLRDVYKGMSKEVVEQVKVNITKSAVKGADKIDIQLKPEDLGHIQIKMQIKDGKVQAHIVASRPETMDILQKEVQNLEKAFNDAGFETDEGSLTFSFSEGNQAGQESEDNTKLRNFIGEMLDGETSEEMANDNWTYSGGLNIRV